MLAEVAAVVCASWYVGVVLVCGVGYIQIWRYYSSLRPNAACLAQKNDEELPHVTVIRPAKGIEPFLYECLASTFHQTYPPSKLTYHFCISSHSDPALPILRQLAQDYSAFDVTVFVEEDDSVLRQHEQDGADFGPNPKIRNMSRAYREAKGDIVWIIDCNVWVGPGVAGRMVDTLCGYGGRRKNKFVHQLPLVVDTTALGPKPRHASGLPPSAGGRLEELFMSSSHAKFYTAINTVLVAPCIVGKSNMFRRSHLDALTAGQGIDYFSHNICEDHLIGDLLWKQPVPASVLHAARHETREHAEPDRRAWGNHALVSGDPAIQPMANVALSEYMARRTRWLRVRKFTVTLATLVEPGTESFLCSVYGAYAATTLPFFLHTLGVPQTWTAFATAWLVSVALWAAVDWTLYRILHSARSVDIDASAPDFARDAWAHGAHRPRRSFTEWLGAWLGREALAFPIWFWAVWGGVTVKWRGKEFWVGMDMRVHKVNGRELLADQQQHARKDR